MNKNNLQEIINTNIRKYFDPMRKQHINVVILNTGNSEQHEMMKTLISYNLIKQGRTIITEGILKGGLRPDIVVLDLFEPIAYEIVKSETKKSIQKKKESYPFRIIEVFV